MFDKIKTLFVLEEVINERIFQEEKWGPRESIAKRADHALAILMEEVGEVAKAILEGDPDTHLAEELIQVAAVAVAWVEGLND